jgi:hypothetical protein
MSQSNDPTSMPLNTAAAPAPGAPAGLPGTPSTTGAGSPAPASSTPDGRSTTFQPVEGGTETRSGGTLMVEAYVVLWVILMAWLVMLWRKQGALTSRLEDLERAIDEGAARAAKK